MTRNQLTDASSGWLFGYISGTKWLWASMRVTGWARTKGSIKEQIACKLSSIKNQTYETDWEIGFTDAILDSLN